MKLYSLQIVLNSKEHVHTILFSISHCIFDDLEPEELVELFKEALIHKRFVQVVLDPLWKLCKDRLIFIRLETNASVLLPSNGKVLLYFGHHIIFEGFSMVESLQQSEELCKFITLVKFLVEFSHLLKDFNEVTHNV